MDQSEQEAELVFGPASFQVRRPGSYVVCALSGQRIPVAELRYWSVARQEAYASAEIGLAAYRGRDAGEGEGVAGR